MRYRTAFIGLLAGCVFAAAWLWQAGMSLSVVLMLMPGMLSEEEMAELEAARGPEFDRLFLIGMIIWVIRTVKPEQVEAE